MKKYLLTYLLALFAFTSIYTQELSVVLSKTEPLCELGKVEVTIISGAQPITIKWSNGELTNAIDQIAPGDYYVKVEDNLKHDTVIFFTIEERICEPTAQNCFTPNQDGYNDTWGIGRLEYFPNFELFVYNRWGQIVHHQENQYIPWDGKSLSVPLPDQTYYYILYFSKSDKNKFINGDVTIIR